ncbi:hypothetical protein GCM10011365_18570 [Marinicella pacifica]|uniref:Peptidase M56 domain-containing protein n=2 Tax=Marinicella pacifica TaxID=1171543 RepID=A0A917CTP6_9GAMM|nr:hypothetical protein GCM10011365_18570 [Marinicella pacifica]
MISYVFINLLISFWAMAINRWMSIPERLKFLFLMLAMVSWLIPFHLFRFNVEVGAVNETIYAVQSLAPYLETDEAVSLWMPTMIQVGLILMLFGALIFVTDVVKLIHKHRCLVKRGQISQYKNVWLVDDLVGACVTGFWQPKIWINTDLFHQAERVAVLAHERQHIQNGDVYWLLVIGFIHRILWFNPVVYFLNKKLRESIELRCDEACQKKFNNNSYQQQLAKIILAHQQPGSTALINEILHNNNFQIKRIQHLSKENIMTTFNQWQISLSFIFIALLSTVSLANQDKLDKAEAGDNEVVVEVAFEVTEQFSGLSETSSTKKQLIVQQDEWQEVQLDRYTVKLKVSVSQSDDDHFMIDTKILNRQNTTLYSPSIMTLSNQSAGIKISADTKNDPAFNLGFTILAE